MANGQRARATGPTLAASQRIAMNPAAVQGEGWKLPFPELDSLWAGPRAAGCMARVWVGYLADLNVSFDFCPRECRESRT